MPITIVIMQEQLECIQYLQGDWIMENQKQEQKWHKRHYWVVKAGKTGRENKEHEQWVE